MPITDNGLSACLISPNEADRNMEPANVVDALFAIARALEHLASVHDVGMLAIADSLDAVTAAVSQTSPKKPTDP